METDQALTEEGYFVTPGDYNQEWLVAILPVPVLIFITGLVSIFLFFNITKRHIYLRHPMTNDSKIYLLDHSYIMLLFKIFLKQRK